MIRVADYIIKRIQQEGVGHIFCVSGGQCVYLMDALRRNEEITAISVHHEQAAAMAATAYSTYNENFGACVVTTGCAGTNTITGVLHAWQDGIPMIVVSGQQNYEQTIAYSGLPLRQVGVQEADIVTLVSSITKYAKMVIDANQIAYELDKAIYMAKDGRKGPVWLDIPLNIQNAMVDEDKLIRYEKRIHETKHCTKPDIRKIMEELKNASRPVVIAGQGVRSAHAATELKKFVEKNSLPVVFTRSAYDILPYEHEYNYGIICATAASRYANFIVQNSDYVLNIGCRLSLDTTGGAVDTFAREAKIVVVDIDEIEHAKKGVAIDRIVLADAKNFLENISEEDNIPEKRDWLNKCKHWKNIFPSYTDDAIKGEKINVAYFIERLSEKMPENSTVLSDAGMTGVEVPVNCHFKETDRFVHSFAQGEMGFALPGALGVAAQSEGMVFAIVGDGSIMMNLQELQTVVRNNYNIKVVINNNNGYSGVRHGQKAHFRGKTIGTDASNGLDFPDFGKIAMAFGMRYIKIEQNDDIETRIEELVGETGPCICEVFTDPDAFSLHNALVMYGKRKFGFRPIEDQSPFIEREVFFEEMIVEPMETSYGKPV